jgi:hypothetical protein
MSNPLSSSDQEEFMEHQRFAELTRLVERSIFHSELKGGYVISGIHVNLPVNGDMTHMVSLDRRMVCETARDARMEESASIKILSQQLAYLIENEMTFEKPYYQENEEGFPVPLDGLIMIDRGKISFPKFVETKTEVYLDCSGGN